MKIGVALVLIFIDGIASKSVANVNRQKEPQKNIEAYDQRQSGKYNFHINVKDVQFIRLDDFKVGDDYSYGDYGDYPESDYDYDPQNLTTSPIWAFLTDKPATTSTKKPKTTTATPAETSSSASTQKIETTTVISEKPTTSSTAPAIIENSTNTEVTMLNESEAKPVIDSNKPASTTTTINSNNITKVHHEPLPLAIDYEEIPVQVIYERRRNGNQQRQQQQQQQKRKKGANGPKRYQQKPSVEIIDPDNLKHHKNVQIIDSADVKSADDVDSEIIRMCAHNEYLDNLGRCRTRRFKARPAAIRRNNLLQQLLLGNTNQ